MSLDEDILSRVLRRRELLVGLGGLSVAALWQAACGSGGSKSATTGSTGTTATTPANAQDAAATCVLSRETTPGPYYIANHLTRRDITDGRPGLPLGLHVAVLDAATCRPIKGADVELWHADASGAYSGVGASAPPGGGPGGQASPSNSKRFLRGHQKSDSRGRVLFDTIYPGWYMGRTPHIHIKVHVGGSVVHTGQLFFDDRTSAAVYRTSSYNRRGQADTTNGSDGIYAAAGGSKARVRLVRRHGRKGFDGQIAVGVTA
jgi:protocatechuate 3,4-dioxygenase beta subunit